MTELLMPNVTELSPLADLIEANLIALTQSADHMVESEQIADSTCRYWWRRQAELAFSEAETWLAQHHVQYRYDHDAKRYILDTLSLQGQDDMSTSV